MAIDEKREQIAKQCDAVTHMATELARVNADYAVILRAGQMDHLIELVGCRTASLMETLGDILNDMDALDGDEDAWMEPVFAEAQRLWPTGPRLTGIRLRRLQQVIPKRGQSPTHETPSSTPRIQG